MRRVQESLQQEIEGSSGPGSCISRGKYQELEGLSHQDDFQIIHTF